MPRSGPSLRGHLLTSGACQSVTAGTGDESAGVAGEVDTARGTETKTYDIEKNTWTGVGEAVEEGREFALVEIRTTK
ncbi:hypothetical protein [Streptomyces sp. NPDC059863]|uniref:hypothetical protein n=1 Tax=unclassified Streptomyces TaxID=2593676 RepID=UPI00365408F2